MGRASRRKRERREGASAAFQRAMIEVELEDQADRIRMFTRLARETMGEKAWREAGRFSVATLACLMQPSPWSCYGCGTDCGQVVSWIPGARRLIEDLGLNRGDAVCIFYPCCPGCEKGDADLTRLIEDRVIRELVSPQTIRLDS